MLHLGDITKISGYDVPIVDCVTFGAPCQDLSVAGKRQGMKHTDLGDDETTRSGLFHEAIRIIKEMRAKDESNGRTGEFIRPRFAIYENVPGAFSSNKGQDFRIVLESLAKVIDKDASIPMPPKDKWANSGCIMGDGWSIAWRVLDARFWGVPQRRRRIALVADFGGECASEILFVKDSLRWDSSQSRTQRKTASTDAEGCIGADDTEGRSYGFPLGFRPENVRMYDEKATTLCIGTRAGFCNGVVSIENHPAVSRVNIDESGKVQTLTSRMGTGGGNVPMVMEAKGLDCYNQQLTGDKAFTLNTIDRHGVALGEPYYIVRRLTPMECERLQGFPDGWTDIGEYTDSNGKKKKTSDSARYKALGNSIALPQWKWIIKRLCSHYERDATLVSLFDGIGGFPYLWEQINGKGSALWASEIEEFPMAVTKVRIGE